ncbi:hypothetical protein SAMN05444396_1113 [Flavobacterium segetis]|uniref:Uncharacterized protein n=2 Tax=Flavobacterium segetis TaxID=271157 RepID=A0A1M5JHG3_9FLAO|nr:hypothetical protein SAMN05444396_1113 [Flavobacterium segetis]
MDKKGFETRRLHLIKLYFMSCILFQMNVVLNKISKRLISCGYLILLFGFTTNTQTPSGFTRIAYEGLDYSVEYNSSHEI